MIREAARVRRNAALQVDKAENGKTIDPRINSSRAGCKGSHSLIISPATALGLAVNHLDPLTGVGNVLRNYL